LRRLSFTAFVPQINVSLASLTTLRLGGNAAFYCQVATDSELVTAVSWAKSKGLPVFVLGGGSNVVVSDAGFDGLVIHVASRGIRSQVSGTIAELTVAAGEPWDSFVLQSVQKGWAGIECLGGIPGQVGSTPIQNVGAYGQDVAETISRIRVLDRSTMNVEWMAAKDLAFSYRDSILRRQLQRWVVLDVVFHLSVSGIASARYAELQRSLAHLPVPSLQNVHDTVIELRKRKSMVLDANDPNTRSAGSFFTNPLVDQATAAHVVHVAQNAFGPTVEVPQWSQPDGRVKLAAGWLIERAGFNRGYRKGPVGISSNHALALVHHGGGQTADLLALARQVRKGVHDTFGVQLDAEPILVGAAW
jgi:UDP-N-acetylmuramate dehydrogenase